MEILTFVKLVNLHASPVLVDSTANVFPALQEDTFMQINV